MDQIQNLIYLIIADIAVCTAAVLFIKHRIMKKYDHELKVTKEEARKADQAKDEFLAGMSHEIRTPITAILGMNEMILRDSDNEDVLRHAKHIEYAGENLLYLINDILDFSKLESGKMSIIEEEYCLSDVVRNLVALAKPKAEQKGLKFTVNVNESTPEHIIGDRLRVAQIITNLLTNAIKYTDSGEVDFIVDWRKLDEKKISLKIEVRDTGRGIREEDVSAIFNKFQRSGMSENNSIEGTGLGLAITQTIVFLMGGELSVDSTYGEGSTFSAVITQTITSEEPIGKLSSHDLSISKDNDSRLTAPGAHIMIVDDMPLNLEVAAGFLKDTEIDIDMANGGAECLSLAAQNTYDIIFLDARMPHPDGVETMHELKKSGIKCPIIVLTANAVNGAKEKYLEEGFDDYLSKPFKSQDLENMIAEYLPDGMVRYVKAEHKDSILPKWLNNIPELDPASGVELCGGADIYLDTLKSFVRYSPEEMNSLRDYAKDDIRTFTVKVHALKSTARIIGADRLSNMAFKLEEAGNDNDIEYIENNTDDLFNAYESLVSALMAVNISESPVQEKPQAQLQIEPSQVNMIFEHLKAYVEDFNDEAISSMTGTLQNYQFPGQSQKKFDSFMVAYHAADWMKMMEILG